MKDEWINFRAAWNAEADRLTHAKLAEMLSFDKSYIGPLGRGNRRFNEDHLERFSVHMELPLTVLFSEASFQIPTKESDEMNKIREMIQAMLTVEDIKLILLGEFTKLKKTYLAEISKKKAPRILCKVLD